MKFNLKLFNLKSSSKAFPVGGTIRETLFLKEQIKIKSKFNIRTKAKFNATQLTTLHHPRNSVKLYHKISSFKSTKYLNKNEK